MTEAREVTAAHDWPGDDGLAGEVPPLGAREPAEDAILLVRRTAIDPQVPERVTGEVLAVDLPARALRTALPVLA